MNTARRNTKGNTDQAQEQVALRSGRRHLLAVWLVTCSAVAGMIGVVWYRATVLGVAALEGDLVGHAATANWLRTKPWWDWRGWSDWFYGGQAIGVNYPPLSHLWLRHTHPVHGQLLAVAIGLLVLLPWGTMRLARAVGFVPQRQRVAVAIALILSVASIQAHWVLSGFHYNNTAFGSWPAMIATVLMLFPAAWAARCRAPVLSGVVCGIAALVNVTVLPGGGVVIILLLATSGASLRQALRWSITAGATTLLVCAWWLVPFIQGWNRLVRYDVPISDSLMSGGLWQLQLLAGLGFATAWAARSNPQAKRLALAATAGLIAAVLADHLGYLRAERLLQVPILVAAVSIAALFPVNSQRKNPRQFRSTAILVGCVLLVGFVVATKRYETLPLLFWLLLWHPDRNWVWGGALAWYFVLLSVPFSVLLDTHESSDSSKGVHETINALSGPTAEGTVLFNEYYSLASGELAKCVWDHPWRTTTLSDGRIRPLQGLYRETSSAAEFISAQNRLSTNFRSRPHWNENWQTGDSLSLASLTAAEALGARWFVQCDADDNFTVYEGPGIIAEGTQILPYKDEDSWHQAAVQWWIAVASETEPLRSNGTPRIPVLWPNPDDTNTVVDHAAQGVKMRTEQDRLIISATAPGWAWLRVPWDPWWFATNGAPLKGGPGHLVAWVDEGTTELHWDVPDHVDQTAIAVTGLSLLVLLVMCIRNRRFGFEIDPDRHRPVVCAFTRFVAATDRVISASCRVLKTTALRLTRHDC